MPFHRRLVTRDGASISAARVAVSDTAAIGSGFFIALVPRLVPCMSDWVGNGRKLFAILRGVLLRAPARTAACRVAAFFPQWVKRTSNACAPREEARPSVSPARYMTTPFWFVSLASATPRRKCLWDFRAIGFTAVCRRLLLKNLCRPEPGGHSMQSC